jgi:hypothetical protein
MGYVDIGFINPFADGYVYEFKIGKQARVICRGQDG